MPSYTRGKPRNVITHVKVSTIANIYYRFSTKDLGALAGVSQADLAALGHIKVEVDDDGNSTLALPAGSLIFVRANAPKPHRVTRKISGNGNQKNVGTFCAVDRLQQALRSGWNLAKPASAVPLNDNARSVTAIAKLSNGALYAFPMNKEDFATYKEALGLKDSTTVNTEAEQAKLVRASSLPRPGKAKKVLANGNTFSSFYSTDASLDGFQRLSQEVVI